MLYTPIRKICQALDLIAIAANVDESGIENISMAAAETKAPRRNIPIAAKRIFFRVVVFYSELTQPMKSKYMT